MKKFYFKKNKKRGSGTLEFLAVFVFLFLFFLTTIDIALYFRQIYIAQSTSDYILANITASHCCNNAGVNNIQNIVNNAITINYGVRNPDAVIIGNNDIFEAQLQNYGAEITCNANNGTPKNVLFSHIYNGIFIFANGVNISSNVSTNVTYF